MRTEPNAARILAGYVLAARNALAGNGDLIDAAEGLAEAVETYVSGVPVELARLASDADA